MKNELTLPARSCTLSEEEMTYTAGGGVAGTLVSLAAGALYIYNYAWGLNETRNWLKKNKTDDVLQTAAKAADATVDYVSVSLFNAVRGVLTAIQFATLWPVTAVAWLTTKAVV